MPGMRDHNQISGKTNLQCKKYSIAQASKLTSTKIKKLFEILAANFPNPQSELNFKDPFELLCAVILSAQATDKSVNLVTPALFKDAPDAKALSELDEETVGELVKSIGLWRAKARNLVAMAKILVQEHDGEVPCDYESLVKLPGVGSKTAKVVLNVAFRLPFIAVDTHIFRVCCRTGLCPGHSVKEVEDKLPSVVPKDYALEAHHYLLLHGRYVCTARNPHCNECDLQKLCLKLDFDKATGVKA